MDDERELTVGSIAEQYPRAVEQPDEFHFLVETTEPKDGGWVENLCLRPNKDPDTVDDYDVVGVGVSRETGESVTLPADVPLNGFERVRPEVDHSS